MHPLSTNQEKKSFIAESRHFFGFVQNIITKNKNIEMHISVDQNVWEINICSAEPFEAKKIMFFFILKRILILF